MTRASFFLFVTPLIVLIASVASSCLAEPAATDYPTLVGRFADESGVEPFVAEEAYIGESEFFVRFSRGVQTYYAGGDWASRISLQELDDAGESGPYILPLQYEQVEAWSHLPTGLTPVRILESNVWQSFRNKLFDALIPTEEKSGIVLDFGLDDYFLFYDDIGEFQATALQNKPGDYAVSKRVAVSDFMSLGWPLFESFLEQRNIDDRRIAFNTGDTGEYSLPFVYVNRDLPLAVLVRQAQRRVVRTTSGAAIPIMQTAGHVAQSHLGGIVFRPVSSVYRLFFVTSDTVAEAMTPDWIINLKRIPIPELSKDPPMDIDKWESSLDSLTGRPASKGAIEYLVDGEQFFTRFIDAASAAESSISLRTYIFDNDDYAEKIGELLKRKSNAGVDVRVLLDGLGTIISTFEKQESLPQEYTGAASVHKFLERESDIAVRQAANPWLTGDHVKTIIVDKKVAFTGGMNIAREYRYDWHDLMVELHGPVVDILQQEFNNAWAHAGFLGDFGYFYQALKGRPQNTEDIGFPMRVLFTRTDDAEIFRAQRHAIRSAQHHIYVENAYFTDDAMLYELAQARRRGVDVRVIMPLVTDRGPITRNNALAANAMLEHGIRVFVYPGMSHVKAAVFDGWACLGSANWDRLSFRINKEINIATSHPPAVERLTQLLFEKDFARSFELTEPFPERWSDHLIELLGDYVF